MWSTTVEDVVNNYDNYTDPYTELKQCLCRAYGKSDMQKVNDLLNLPPLGSEKLSVLMDNILSLWPDTTTKNTSKLLLGLFLGSLPLLLGAQLANFPATTPGQLTATDAIWAQSGGQVSAAEVVVAAAVPGLHCSLSPHHNAGGNRGRAAQPSLVAGGSTKKRRLHNHIPVANRHRFYHARWGSKARQCDRCTWTPGN